MKQDAVWICWLGPNALTLSRVDRQAVRPVATARLDAPDAILAACRQERLPLTVVLDSATETLAAAAAPPGNANAAQWLTRLRGGRGAAPKRVLNTLSPDAQACLAALRPLRPRVLTAAAVLACLGDRMARQTPTLLLSLLDTDPDAGLMLTQMALHCGAPVVLRAFPIARREALARETETAQQYLRMQGYTSVTSCLLEGEALAQAVRALGGPADCAYPRDLLLWTAAQAGRRSPEAAPLLPVTARRDMRARRLRAILAGGLLLWAGVFAWQWQAYQQTRQEQARQTQETQQRRAGVASELHSLGLEAETLETATALLALERHRLPPTAWMLRINAIQQQADGPFTPIRLRLTILYPWLAADGADVPNADLSLPPPLVEEEATDALTVSVDNAPLPARPLIPFVIEIETTTPVARAALARINQAWEQQAVPAHVRQADAESDQVLSGALQQTIATAAAEPAPERTDTLIIEGYHAPRH